MRTIFTGVSLLTIVAGLAIAQEPRIIRQPVAVFTAEKKDLPGKAIQRVSLSHDGKLAAVVRVDGSMAVHEVGKDVPLFTTPEMADRNGSPFCTPAFSSDSEWLAYSRSRGAVEIVAARTGKPRASIDLSRGRIESVDGLAFSLDGKTLAVSSGVLYHKDLAVFDAATGKRLAQPLTDVDGIAWQVVFSPDGKRLIVNHWSMLYVIDAATWKVAAKLPSKTFGVFFKDGRTFAIDEDSSAIREVTADGTGKTPFGKLAEKAETFVAMRAAIAGSPPIIALPADNSVSIRDMQGKELFRVQGENSPIRKLGLSGDGRTLIVERNPTRAEVFRME